jgi:hypothetical protein
MVLQTILVPKSNYTEKEAIKWIEQNKYKLLKIDETTNFYRFRQTIPGKNVKYYTKTLPNGIKLVFEY